MRCTGTRTQRSETPSARVGEGSANTRISSNRERPTRWSSVSLTRSIDRGSPTRVSTRSPWDGSSPCSGSMRTRPPPARRHRPDPVAHTGPRAAGHAGASRGRRRRCPRPRRAAPERARHHRVPRDRIRDSTARPGTRAPAAPMALLGGSAHGARAAEPGGGCVVPATRAGAAPARSSSIPASPGAG